MFLTPVSFSGWTMLACLVIIWTFTTRQMRQYFYNSFLGVHHLFLLFFIMMYYHPVRYQKPIAALSWHSFESLCFSHIIKYQENVINSPSTCDLMERLNTTHAEIFMKKYCKERPIFTEGKKNVIQSNWHLTSQNRDFSLFAVLDLAVDCSFNLLLRFYFSVLQEILHPR